MQLSASDSSSFWQFPAAGRLAPTSYDDLVRELDAWLVDGLPGLTKSPPRSAAMHTLLDWPPTKRYALAVKREKQSVSAYAIKCSCRELQIVRLSKGLLGSCTDRLTVLLNACWWLNTQAIAAKIDERD